MFNIRKQDIAAIASGLLVTAFLFLGVLRMTSPLTIQGIMSPLANFRNQYLHTEWKDKVSTFSFIPGWSYYKMGDIDFSKNKTIAFFDLPIDGDGSIIKDVDGYQLFKSDAAQELFSKAKAQNAKVLVNISQTDDGLIKALLDNPKAQENLIAETINELKETGINGVVIDFEFEGKGTEYKDKFTSFIGTLNEATKSAVPNSIVDVAVLPTASQQEFYDIKSLSQKSNNIMMLAYNFPELEFNNGALSAPKYGYKENDYWKKVSGYVNSLTQNIPASKLSVETAWYGNGDNYPLVTSSTTPQKGHMNTLKTPLDPKIVNKLIADVPNEAKPAVRRNLPYIAKALEEEGILNLNVLAYALATIKHETADTFEPIEEIKGRKSARRLGYEGGADYLGRGFIQLTHMRNYLTFGERIGMGDQLVKNPDLALDPGISAKILAAFFLDNGVAQAATNGDFVSARTPINPDDQGYWIATLAYEFLQGLA